MRRSGGFILVSVMIAAATLLTAATAFAWFARATARAAAARERIYRFRTVAEIAANVAARRISEDTNGWDGLTESLYKPNEYLKIEIGNYTAEVRISPLNDKIPISGLLLPDGATVRSEYEAAWENVWERLGLPRLASEVLDFIDEDESQRLGGAERDVNINRMISDLSELRAMAEITDEVLFGKDDAPGLSHYVTTIESETININVASAAVISALDDSLTESHAGNVVSYRAINPITDIDGLSSVPGFPAEIATKLANIIAFESTHFLLAMSVSDEAQNIRNYRVIVKRGDSGFYRWEE